MNDAAAVEIMRGTLERIVGDGRDVPEMTCREATSGQLCGRPATFVARIEGMGHVVVCDACARYYADAKPFELPRDAPMLVGNLRDQARNALMAVEASEA